MLTHIGEKVSVNFKYNHLTGKSYPKEIVWRNKEYLIDKLGLHYTLFKGETLFHIFSVTTDHYYFRLVLNTKNLMWTLEEVADENVN